MYLTSKIASEKTGLTAYRLRMLADMGKIPYTRNSRNHRLYDISRLVLTSKKATHQELMDQIETLSQDNVRLKEESERLKMKQESLEKKIEEAQLLLEETQIELVTIQSCCS